MPGLYDATLPATRARRGGIFLPRVAIIFPAAARPGRRPESPRAKSGAENPTGTHRVTAVKQGRNAKALTYRCEWATCGA